MVYADVGSTRPAGQGPAGGSHQGAGAKRAAVSTRHATKTGGQGSQEPPTHGIY